jgi:hypothetical protein
MRKFDPKFWWRLLRNVVIVAVLVVLVLWGLKFTVEHPNAPPGVKGGLDWGIVTDNPIFPKRWN